MILTYSVSAALHADIFRNFLRWQPPPVPAIFDGLPYPSSRRYPQLFRQNDRKGCSLDYLDDRDFGHFLFGFGSTGKKSRGGVNTCNQLENIKDRIIFFFFGYPPSWHYG